MTKEAGTTTERVTGRLGQAAYLTAFALWAIVALLKYTFWRDKIPMTEISEIVQYIVLVLLLIKLVCDFPYDCRNLCGLFLLMLFMTIAYAGKKLPFAVMFALIFAARGVDLKKILKLSFVLQLLVFGVTVLASQTGILQDYIWEEGTRYRHGLGFTHCMLASHFGLFLSVVYLAIVGKMTVLRALVIAAGNYILFRLTDGKTDFYLSILLIPLGFLFGNLGQKLKKEKLLGIMASVVPMFLLFFSYAVTKAYDAADPGWERINQVFNNRLSLGNRALNQYGWNLFGHKISWVGASSLYYDPTKVYNYVDNAFLMMLLTYGAVFIVCYCVGMGIVLSRHMAARQTMLVTCLAVSLAFGMINPQSMFLTYNPLLVLLAQVWNPAAGPREEKEKKDV